MVETKRTPHSASWHMRSNVWHPPTDVYETETSVVVKVEAAGIRDDDLDVIVQDDMLLIQGSRSDSSERRAYHQMEIPFGKFSVSLKLPANVRTEGAEAEYKDGFLTIILPKEVLDI